jgi:hypothetical protein
MQWVSGRTDSERASESELEAFGPVSEGSLLASVVVSVLLQRTLSVLVLLQRTLSPVELPPRG